MRSKSSQAESPAVDENQSYSGGTEGSNLAPSSGESANYRFRDPTDVKAMLQVLAAERKSDDADIRGSS
jgi:hypothetical protein